jgi:hypothetical protein
VGRGGAGGAAGGLKRRLQLCARARRAAPRRPGRTGALECCGFTFQRPLSSCLCLLHIMCAAHADRDFWWWPPLPPKLWTASDARERRAIRPLPLPARTAARGDAREVERCSPRSDRAVLRGCYAREQGKGQGEEREDAILASHPAVCSSRKGGIYMALMLDAIAFVGGSKRFE